MPEDRISYQYTTEEQPSATVTFDPYRKTDLFFEALAKWFRENEIILDDEASADQVFLEWLMTMKPKERKETLHSIAMCAETGAIGYFDGQRGRAVNDLLLRFENAKQMLDAFVDRHYAEANAYFAIQGFFMSLRYDFEKIFPGVNGPSIRF